MDTPHETTQRPYDCDVLVIGAGVSGYCAAIQAGRLGWSVILLEKDEVLGGNSGPNLGVGITGADRYNPYATETGLIQEMQEAAAWAMAFTQVSPGMMPYNIARRYEALVQEYLEQAGVLILKRHYAHTPLLDDGGRIVAVIAEDLAAFQTARIHVRHVVIEASGDGEIGVRAGAAFAMGSEAQSAYGERSAPPAPSPQVQGTSLVAIAHKTHRDVIFIPPANTPPFQPRIWQGRVASFIHHHDRWFDGDATLRFLYVTETGGHLDTVRDDGQIYDALLRQLWAEWHHIKNGPHRAAARQWDLLWVSPKAGKRESRRLLGDVVLTQTDVEDGRLFPDDIAYGGHDLDDHIPFAGGSNIYAHSVPPLYGIPYRACYSRNVPNLLLAGRLISASHIAHASSRVMRTGGAIGQAVGYAAALCCKYGCTPRAVYEQHLDELQRGLLAADATILARPLHDGRDLAQQATVSATSELRFNDQHPGQRVPLIAAAGVLLWDWPPTLDGVEFYLQNPTDTPQPLRLTVWRARRTPKWLSMDDYEAHGRNDLRAAAFRAIGSAAATLPPHHDGWCAVPFPTPLDIGAKDMTSDDDRVLIALDANPAIEWAVARQPVEMAEMVEHSHHAATWHALGVMGTLRLTPPPALGEATHIADGFHRRYSRAPLHLWLSDPEQPLPQDVTLTWPEPQRFNEVCVTFDNLTRHRHDAPWECGERVAPMLVKAYELACWDGAAWRLLAAVDDNCHRFRRHRFDAVTAGRLRLRVLATHGNPPQARVYQVRVTLDEK